VNGFLAIIGRDLTLAWREGSAVGTALGFYLVVVALLPLGLGPDLKLLSRIAPGVLWIALLLAALLSLPRVFEADHEDGSLEVMVTGPLPLEFMVAGKALAHWISTGIPLALLAPVLGLMMNLDPGAYPALAATMLTGTLAVSFLGVAGAALTIGTRRGGLLVALLVLPFYVPTLIFGISAMGAANLAGGNFEAPFLILTAISLASLVLGPVAAAAALRLQMQ
jgi:heme exporter protein B